MLEKISSALKSKARISASVPCVWNGFQVGPSHRNVIGIRDQVLCLKIRHDNNARNRPGNFRNGRNVWPVKQYMLKLFIVPLCPASDCLCILVIAGFPDGRDLRNEFLQSGHLQPGACPCSEERITPTLPEP